MRDNKFKVYCTFQDAPHHNFYDHPESPKRLKLLKGWLQNPPYPEIQWLSHTSAKEADVLLVHRIKLLEYLQNECQQGPHEFEPSPSYVTRSSYQDALRAVGATLAISRRIIKEGTGNGFAIVRPPGHHAEPGESMGFCLLNNVAIAAADAVASGMGKVAIVDFDVHHGNGTQTVFWDTPQVGYFSTHETNIYPGTGQLHSAPHARGRIINLPLPPFSGNLVFKKIFDQVLEPWISQFQPEMIMVSAGYDGHFSDPLTTFTLNTKGYYQIVKSLVDLAVKYCKGKLLFVLEGGYNTVALKDNIQASLAAMCGHDSFDSHFRNGPAVAPDVGNLIADIKKYHYL